jgi:hypothetical protein
MPEFHSEPYLYLAGLTHKAALVAWGAFFFKVKGHELDGKFKLVDDSDLKHVHPPRKQTIGASSEPYGPARVEVFDSAGNLASFAETATTNHVWLTGLLPDTEYRYRVLVNGDEWGKGDRRDWSASADSQGLMQLGNRYDNRFRTHPHPDQSAPLTFAVLGDFGTGVRKLSKPDRRQREVASALEQAVNQKGVRLILTTGDNIYAGKTVFGLPVGATGDEDDDWFFTFYQPYRYIINRVPVYPCVGNHDTDETEASDDRLQLMDNFFLNERFSGEEAAGRSSMNPGLFYKFHFGSEIEFVCIDTSRQLPLFGDRFFNHPNHTAFVDSAFPDLTAGSDDRTVWRFPFSHHPPFCAGPQHSNSKSIIKRLIPLFKRSGVRVHFSGHEHNFQHSHTDGIDYFISGGGGKVREQAPRDFDDAHTASWAANSNFLVVDVDNDRVVVSAHSELTGEGEIAHLTRKTPAGETISGPIVITRG